MEKIIFTQAQLDTVPETDIDIIIKGGTFHRPIMVYKPYTAVTVDKNAVVLAWDGHIMSWGNVTALGNSSVTVMGGKCIAESDGCSVKVESGCAFILKAASAHKSDDENAVLIDWRICFEDMHSVPHDWKHEADMIGFSTPALVYQTGEKLWKEFISK